jgi:hypothetical protein
MGYTDKAPFGLRASKLAQYFLWPIVLARKLHRKERLKMLLGVMFSNFVVL